MINSVNRINRSLYYSSLSEGKSLLIQCNILQQISKALILRLIFHFENCFRVFFCLIYLERDSGKGIKLESKQSSTNNKEFKTLHFSY